jgi:peptidoglycan/xylan/chitin deacetylase (PgdA/CDA1 family)
VEKEYGIMENGIFTISLDFELFWGVRDHRTIETYGENLKNVHVVVPRLLDLFNKYNVHCTWATVGILFCKNKQALIKYLPEILPAYSNTYYNPYAYINTSELDEIYHFAPGLISLIGQYKGQEIATHTFSHYYCMEDGQNIYQFEADIAAAVKVAAETGITLESIVFPRNQFNEDYLYVCKKYGITNYRATENHWLYTPRSRDNESRIRRGFRFIDAYCNISGHHLHAITRQVNSSLVNIPSSRFLRPYSNSLSFIEVFRLKRICNGMKAAAKQKKLFHLWWHPHNFGSNIENNFSFLEKILQEYTSLKKDYNMQSFSMKEIADNLKYGERI